MAISGTICNDSRTKFLDLLHDTQDVLHEEKRLLHDAQDVLHDVEDIQNVVPDFKNRQKGQKNRVFDPKSGGSGIFRASQPMFSTPGATAQKPTAQREQGQRTGFGHGLDDGLRSGNDTCLAVFQCAVKHLNHILIIHQLYPAE